MSEILIRNFCTLKNKYDFNHVYTLPLKISSVIKKIGSGLIFYVFASVANILIGNYDDYKKK